MCSKPPTLAPADQWFQGDDPDGSHNEIIWSLNQNRPVRDERREPCDECGQENDQQQNNRDARELARGGGGRLRHWRGVADGPRKVCSLGFGLSDLLLEVVVNITG